MAVVNRTVIIAMFSHFVYFADFFFRAAQDFHSIACVIRYCHIESIVQIPDLEVMLRDRRGSSRRNSNTNASSCGHLIPTNTLEEKQLPNTM